MGTKRWLALGITAALAATMMGCSIRNDRAPDEGAARTSEIDQPVGKDIVAPVVRTAGELADATVELVVGQVLSINTAGLAVASYRGAVENPKIAVFTAGHSDDSAEFNPGVTALAVGSTEVTLTNEQGGVEPFTFEVVVTAKK